MTGYYRKFVKDYAKYLKKGADINVKDSTYIEAFEKLRTLISTIQFCDILILKNSLH